MIVAKKITVSGKVQGVFFRASTQQRAQELGLVGWVKNEINGSVSIHVEGEEVAVAALLEWCSQGPPQARVTQVEVEDTTIKKCSGFAIEH